MTLWRISNHDDLTGLGGERSDGRWHTAGRGKRIVYLSEHPALALIEVLVNLQGLQGLYPDEYQLMKVQVPDTASKTALPVGSLSKDWRGNMRETQSAGNAWLLEKSSALLAVPSAPSPESLNYLLNPLHAEARSVSLEWCKSIEYDKRFFQI